MARDDLRLRLLLDSREQEPCRPSSRCLLAWATAFLSATLLTASLSRLHLANGEGLRSTTPGWASEAALDAAAAAPQATGGPSSPPPLLRVSAPGLRAAGLVHGRLARNRIQGWFATAEMRRIFRFAASSAGAGIFERLKRDNAREFPEYVEEMRGLAEGAQVSMDEVWCANLLNEFDNLIPEEGAAVEGCSDLFAVAEGGFGEGFAEGHNEDWSDTVKHFMYFVSYKFEAGSMSTFTEPGPPFSDCAGLTYPGHVLGSPPTWNNHGMYATQNHLTPRHSRPGGLALAFVKRRALCETGSLDAFVAALTVPGWSTGASVSAVDLKARRMVNVELYEDRHSVLEVTESMGNYSHFNQYRRLQAVSGRPLDDPQSFLNDPRQARVDELPPMRSAADIEAVLGDRQVFSRHGTIATLVLNGTTSTLSVWCCGRPSSRGVPVYKWNLSNFLF
mmetsp:Transcript_26957/g.77349  ORF Transcript_26957/g.77349 Transcript_26957/m.77349 type:complete len:448 (+) Transcript_26957:39-1382(+)